MSRLLSRGRKGKKRVTVSEPEQEEESSSGGKLRKLLLGLGVLGVAYVARRRRKSGDAGPTGTGQQSYGTTEEATAVDVSTEEVDERETAGMETDAEDTRDAEPTGTDESEAAGQSDEDMTGKPDEMFENEGFGSEEAPTEDDDEDDF